MRSLLAIIGLLILLPFYTHAQPETDSAWLMTHYTKREVSITMRDGVKLYTAIYEPTAVGKHPILLNRTPYSIAPYGAAFRKYWTIPYMAYLKKNYIMVLQDVRGKFMSEGDYVDVRPYIYNKEGNQTDEASDTYDTIDWLIKNVKNNNKKVGMYGISYPGFYSTMGALSGHPALKAVSPQAPVTEWFIGDDFHHNGALMEMDAFGFYSSFGKPRPQPTQSYAKGFDFYTNDNYEFYLKQATVDNLSRLMGDSITFWTQLCNHPNYDSWWQERNTRNDVQHIPSKVATLVVGGLFDAEDGYGAWNLYKSIEKKSENNNKLVMGPWSHGQWAHTPGEYLGNIRFGSKTSEWYQQNVEQPFFAYYLEGKGDINQLKEATIFVTGTDEWRTFDQWPPAQTTEQPMFLQSDGSLTSTAPALTDERGYKQYTSDPAKPVPFMDGVITYRTAEYMDDDQRFAANRPDVLVYETDSLPDDITLAGPIVADLYASLTTTDADFVVKLIDVYPDHFTYDEKKYGKGNGKGYPMGGYQMMVRGEIMRGRYRNSFEHPQAFKPGEITRVKYTLPDVAHTFKKGHRIMIQIQSSWFPLADRNPQQYIDIYHCDAGDFIPTQVRIYSSKEHPSSIILPYLTNKAKI
jgi:putative CocE/NonD family hydrolase